MYQWTESDLKRYLETLEKNDTRDVAKILFTMAGLDMETLSPFIPTGNAKIIAYLEQLIEDRRGYVISWEIPSGVGELRWLAAQALACEYAYQGIETPIILKDVFIPTRDYETDPTHRDKTIDERIQQGLLPTKTEIIKPQDYVNCCSKEAVEKRKRKQNSDE